MSGERKEHCQKYFDIASRIQRIKEFTSVTYWKKDIKSIEIGEGEYVSYFESLIFDTEAELKNYSSTLLAEHWTQIFKYIQEFQVIIESEEDTTNEPNSSEPQPLRNINYQLKVKHYQLA